MLNTRCFCAYAFYSGKDLAKIIDFIIDIGNILDININLYLAIHQAILNLLGENE